MKTSINLLPGEYTLTEKQQRKFNIVQGVSVFIILTLFLLAAIVVALSIIQSRNIEATESQIRQFENAVTLSKDKEASLFVLKNRLNTIVKLLKSPSKQLSTYNYVGNIIPQSVTLSSSSLDRSGNLILSMLAPDINSLKRAIEVLTDQAAFEVFQKVEIENLARDRSGAFRVDLRIIPK